MLLKISHKTEYRYDGPVGYALQRLRLEPRSDAGQTVISWQIDIDGGRPEVSLTDHHGNQTLLISSHGQPDAITIHAHGQVETSDTAGITGPHRGLVPLWLYMRPTALTKAGPGIRKLVSIIKGASGVDQFHLLMAEIATNVEYETGTTESHTTAEEAYVSGSGVCQDHAHIFIAASRAAGFPARYVSGYLMMNDRIDQVASHAWAEVHISDLGWVGFDVSNKISPDARYVRLAVGFDYREANPASGIRHGAGNEALDVHIMVEQ